MREDAMDYALSSTLLVHSTRNYATSKVNVRHVAKVVRVGGGGVGWRYSPSEMVSIALYA